MSEKPILFSGPMVRAILDGAKMQTRRLRKSDDDKPLCVVGDTLWVREAWRADRLFDDRPPRDVPEWSPTLMLADETHRGGHLGHPGRYRHARFMPRWASRLSLRVTGVRVERLDRCNGEDAEREGALHWARATPASPSLRRWKDAHDYSRYAAWMTFAALWEHVHGEGAWERDACRWVWVYTFEVAR